MAFYDEKTGDLITWLKTKAAITAIVGEGTAAKIYPRRVPEETTGQALVFVRVNGRDFDHLSAESGIRRDVVQFYSYGTTSSAADALDIALRGVFAPSDVPIRETVMGVTTVNLVRGMSVGEQGEDLPVKADAAYRYWTMSAFEFFIRT